MDDITDTDAQCIFCNASLDDNKDETVALKIKGSLSVNAVSQQRGDNIQTKPGQKVHIQCRKDYCKPQSIDKARKRETTSEPLCETRNKSGGFNYKNHCLFCATPIGEDRDQKRNVQTLEFRDTMLRICHTRQDKWSSQVQARLLNVFDLPAAESVYHQRCSINFRTKCQIPATYSPGVDVKKRKIGRPKDTEKTEAFFGAVDYLQENDDETLTINDLVERMKAILSDPCDAYSGKYMKSKLLQHFGERIIVTEINGRPNVVTFRTTVNNVIQDLHNQKQQDPQTEKLNIIKAAAKLIREDIKAFQSNNDYYPSSDDIASIDKNVEYLPQSLKLLLQTLFTGKNIDIKLASIGQAIIQATRPKVLMAPLQIGLGVQLHHHFGSRFLIDSLNNHGFCCSYHEIQKFEKSAAMTQGTDISGGVGEERFLQYAADNVDHNIATLDGKGTFHGMGIIATITPGKKVTHCIPRLKATFSDIAKVGGIKIKYHTGEINISHMLFSNMKDPGRKDCPDQLSLLYKVSLLFKAPRPSWSGMMQSVHNGPHPGKSSILFLPMIDMNPSDLSCIYSTLSFLVDHAKQYDITPVVTFDQPLYHKALMIVESEPIESELRKVVVRLGGFHTEMCFLATIGGLMAGSGLRELLELIYAPNAVEHILNGKAVSRAVRAHFLVEAALNTYIAAEAFQMPLPKVYDQSNDEVSASASDAVQNLIDNETSEATAFDLPNDDINTSGGCQNLIVERATSLLNDLMNGSVSIEDLEDSDVITEMHRLLSKWENSRTCLRTARLWLQYIEMVDILKQFLQAERLGNWELHLKSLSEMLPYLAAGGHNLYTKSGRLYLQQMDGLRSENPTVYEKLKAGYHVVRRSNRQWAGLSTDLVIEQVLMRSVKSTGGLTRGRGMTECQRLVWLLGMPACADVNRAMQEFTGRRYESSDQHKYSTLSRQTQDAKDIQLLLDDLSSKNPFIEDPTLRSISSGIIAGPEVNVDKAKDVGIKILTSMNGCPVKDFSFKRKYQAITLQTKSSIKIDGEQICVDPQLLFQRLVVAAKVAPDSKSLFRYELCSYPPALFDSNMMLREAQKAVLAEALWNELDNGMKTPTGHEKIVIDGGSLIHRVFWPSGSFTYKDLCAVYTNYVTRRYGSATVVFDGYNLSTTKDMTQHRRAGHKLCPTVAFDEIMNVKLKKDTFLANKKNKQRLISMLTKFLKEANCVVFQAEGDADLLMVQITIQYAEQESTVLVGDDTDLLILLLHYTNQESHDIFFKPEQRKGTTRRRLWHINAAKNALGPNVCNHILFIHAIGGCDTTSHIHSIGKGTILKKIQNDASLQAQAHIFQMPSLSKEMVATAGEKALILLYNGKLNEGLDALRYRKFCEKAAVGTSYVKPQTLPPTFASSKFHSYRVYHQIQQWCNREIPPDEWGWKQNNERYIPIMTDLPPAPSELLRLIRCNCKTECRSERCTCRKNHVRCSNVCGQCKGVACSNVEYLEDVEPEVQN